MIIRWLQKLPANKKFVPDLVRDPEALLADAKRLVKEHKHDDPALAVTDKSVLFWSESKVCFVGHYTWSFSFLFVSLWLSRKCEEL